MKSYQNIKDSILKNHYTREYNDKGLLIREESINRQIENPPYLIICKKRVITYDLYGNIEQITLFDGEDLANWQNRYFDILIIKYIYTYDTYNNWIKRVEYIGESEDKLKLNQIDNRIIDYY